MLPVSNISTALSKVTYPMFASIKDDNIKLKNAYRKLLLQVAFWIAPMMALGIVIAKPLFELLLTDKWLPAVPYFQLLCISGVLYPFHAYNLNILNVKGRSDLFLKLEVIKKVLITLGIVFSAQYGIYGLIIFQVVNSFICFWINTYYSGKFINYSGLQQMLEVLPIITCASFIGFLLWIFSYYVLIPLRLKNIVIVPLYILIYAIFYFIACRLMRISALQDFKQIILKK